MDEARPKPELTVVERLKRLHHFVIFQKLYDEHMDEARPKPKLTVAEIKQHLSSLVATVYHECLPKACIAEIPNDESNDENWNTRMHCIGKNRTFEFKFINAGDCRSRYCWVGWMLQKGTGSEVNNPTWLNQMNTKRIKFLIIFDDNILYTKRALDWDGKMSSHVQLQDKSTGCNLNKYVEVDEPFNRETRKKVVQCISSFVMADHRVVEPLDVPGRYELFSLKKRKQTVERVSSFVIATTEFHWIITDICSQLSTIHLQPEHSYLFIWSSLLELLGFLVFVCAILAMILVGARFTRLQSIMLMFWAIWMLVRSAKSLTSVSALILGILFTGWHVLLEKQPPHKG